jgi:hypothetical protein
MTTHESLEEHLARGPAPNLFGILNLRMVHMDLF